MSAEAKDPDTGSYSTLMRFFAEISFPSEVIP
jgi:hypothetical protein